MSTLGRTRAALLIAICVTLALVGLSGCAKDGPLGGDQQPKTFMGSVGMYSLDGKDVFVVFASCDHLNFFSVLRGPPSFTVKDDKGQVLWKLSSITPSEAATSQPPATGAPGYFSKNSDLKVGAVPNWFRADMAWQPPPTGTVVKFEGEDRLKLFSGSYRVGDTDPPGSIRVDGQASTRDALEKKECGSQAQAVPALGTNPTSTTR